MATIDPNIAMGYKPVQIENPLNQMAAYSQIQSGQQTQQMNALKMRQAQQEFDTQNRLGKAYAGATNRVTGEIDYNRLLGALAEDDVSATAIPSVIKSKKDAELAAQQLKTQQTTEQKNIVETKNAALKNIREKTSDLQFNPSDDNVRAHAQDAILHGVWTQAQADQNTAEALAVPIAQRPAYFAKKGLDAEKRVTTTETARANAERERVAAEQLKVSQGQLGVSQQRLANETNPVLQANLAEAKAAGDYFGKNKAAAAQALPAALENATQAIRLIDEMIGTAEVRDKNGKVIKAAGKEHPGFSNYVGIGFPTRFVEGSDAASFEIRQKQIEGKAFLEAFNVLRGGGAITEKEGEKGTLAIMRMNKATSEAEYKAAARELQEVLRTGVNTMRAKAGQPSGGKGGGGGVDYDALVNKYTQ